MAWTVVLKSCMTLLLSVYCCSKSLFRCVNTPHRSFISRQLWALSFISLAVFNSWDASPSDCSLASVNSVETFSSRFWAVCDLWISEPRVLWYSSNSRAIPARIFGPRIRVTRVCWCPLMPTAWWEPNPLGNFWPGAFDAL